jgi:hypothetical protein
MTGCGDDEETLVIIDVEQLCEDSLEAMRSQGCMNNAYANVDDLKDCFVDCGPEDNECLEDCLNVPGAGFSGCSGDVAFLFEGECGVCYTNCFFEFVGDVSDPGCLFDPNPDVTGTDCLDALYVCVDDC